MSLLVNIQNYWKCDEASGNINDIVGGLTLTNNGSTPFAAGKINNCIDFGTSNSSKYFNQTATRPYTGGAFTYAFWVNIRTAPTSGNTQTIFVQEDGTTSNIAFFEYRNVSGTLTLAGGKSKFNVGNDEVTVASTLTTGTWYHICCTFDGTNVILYLNAVSQGTTTSSGNGSGASNETSVGRWTAGTNYTTAYVDEIGFWTSALSQADINVLYNGGNGVSYPFYSVFGNYAPFIRVGNGMSRNERAT